MTNRTKSSEEIIVDGHTLHTRASDTKLPVECDRYSLQESELCKINGTKNVSY
jgi:hypothetical protein